MANYINNFASYNWVSPPSEEFFNIPEPSANPIVDLFVIPLEETKVLNKEIKKVSIKPEVKERAKKITNKVAKSPESFESAFEKAAKIDPSIKNRKDFFVRTAKRESNFNPTILNRYGAPCYGYFLMHLLNINNLAGVSVLEYINNPVLQILTANKLYNLNLLWLRLTGLYEIGRLKGYSEGAMITGCWLGPTATLKYLLGQGNPSDKHWSKDGKTGVSVGDLMNGWMSGKY